MSRLRCYLVPTLLLLPLVFICGKLLLTPVWVNRPDTARANYPEVVEPWWETGWPWVFLESSKEPKLIRFGSPSVQNEFLEGLDVIVVAGFPRVTRPTAWYRPLLVADILVLSVFLVLAWCFFTWIWRRSECRIRFSIRGLLILVGIIAGGLGWWESRARAWRYEQQFFQSWWQRENRGALIHVQDMAFDQCPEWLRRLVPTSNLTIFCRATSASTATDLTDEEAEAVLAALRAMPYVRKLSVENFALVAENRSTDGLLVAGPHGEHRRSAFFTLSRVGFRSPLRQLTHIEFPRGAATLASDSTLAAMESGETLEILGALPLLQDLRFEEFPVTDRGLAHLAKSKSLRSLSLRNTKVTDAGIGHLRDLQLRELDLCGTAITYSAVDTLTNLQSLETLDLNSTAVTDAGLLRLMALPRLEWLRVPDPHHCSPSTLEALQRKIKHLNK